MVSELQSARPSAVKSLFGRFGRHWLSVVFGTEIDSFPWFVGLLQYVSLVI